MKPLLGGFALLALLLGPGRPVAAIDEFKPQLDASSVAPATTFGLIRLPRVVNDSDTATCRDVSRACALEAAGSVPEALTIFESRMPVCGLTGWERKGSLGAGHQATVSLRHTPCGLLLATKSPHDSNNIAHILKDCAIAAHLSSELGTRHCPACFPRVYLMSNLTGVCYQEYVPSLPIAAFMRQVGINATHGLGPLKRLVHDSLGLLMALKRQGVRHNDLTFRNILVRLPAPDAHHIGTQRSLRKDARTLENGQRDSDRAVRARRQLGATSSAAAESHHDTATGTGAVIPPNFPDILAVDFGAAASTTFGKSLEDFHQTGNKGHSDCYTVACQYYMFLNPSEAPCRQAPPPLPLDGSRRMAGDVSIGTYLIRMMHTCIDPNGLPDYGLLQAQLREVRASMTSTGSST